MNIFEETKRYYVIAGTNAVAIYGSKDELNAHRCYFRNPQITDHHDLVLAEFLALNRLRDILPEHMTPPKYIMPGFIYYRDHPVWLKNRKSH